MPELQMDLMKRTNRFNTTGPILNKQTSKLDIIDSYSVSFRLNLQVMKPEVETQESGMEYEDTIVVNYN